MSGFIRQINSSDGAPITPPTTVKESVAKMVVFANDAAYEAIYGAGSQGDIYYNSTELLVREHNGTEWVYGQNGINALEDSTSTGSSQDLDPTYHNLIQVSNGSLTSVRSINDAQTSICYLVNATGNDILLLNEDGGAPSGEELMLPGAVNFTLEDGNVAHFVKDSITNAWRYTNAAGSGGGDGSGTGAKNYVLSPDSSTNVTDVGGSSSTDTTTLADLPEETKGVGVLVTQTAGSIGDTSTWETNAIDDGDGGRNGSAEMYWKTKAGYVADSASIQWYNSDTSEILRSYDIPADSSGRISDYADSTVIMTAGENVKPRIYWNVTSETNGLVVSGAGTLAETRLVGDAGEKTYTESEVTITSSNAGGTITCAITLKKDHVSNIWYASGRVDRYDITSATTSGVITIAGLNMDASSSFRVGISASSHDGSQDARGYAITDENINWVSSSNTNDISIMLNNIPLTAKPTWADFDGSVMFGTEAQAQNYDGLWNTLGAAITTTLSDIRFTTKEYEEAGDGNYDTATGIFTAPAAMKYDFVINLNLGGGPTFVGIHLTDLSNTIIKSVQSSPNDMTATITADLALGQQVKLRGQVGTSSSTSNVATNNYLSIMAHSKKSSKATGFPFADQNPGEYGMVKYEESGEGDLGTITGWASPGSKKYRWTKVMNKIDFWFYITATGGSSSSSTTFFDFDLPGDVPSPEKHMSNDTSNEYVVPISGSTNSNNYVKQIMTNTGSGYKPGVAMAVGTALNFWVGHATWMLTDKS